jgi:hypothetical protein
MIGKATPFALALVLSTVAVEGHGAIIHDNGTYNPLNFGAHVSEGIRRVADGFSVAAADTIRSTQFWGTHWSSGNVPANDSFTMVVYGNGASNLPDGSNIIGTSALTLVSRTDTGFDHFNFPGANILEYIMDLASPIALPSAGTYWLSIHHADVGSTDFFWQETGNDNSVKPISSTSGQLWVNANSGAVAYNISNTFAAVSVAEPGTLALSPTYLGKYEPLRHCPDVHS